MCQLCVGCGKEALYSNSGSGLSEKPQTAWNNVSAPTEVVQGQEITAVPEIFEEKQQEMEAPVTAAPETVVPTMVPAVTAVPTTEVSTAAPDAAERQKTEAEKVSSIPAIAPKTQAPEVTPVPTDIQVTQAPAQPEVKPESIVTAAPSTPAATVAPQVHTHSIVTETKVATCLTAGVTREYCEVCGEVVKEEALSAPGHDFIKSVWELPTCMKGGYYNNVCNRCGQVECVTQEPLPHEVEDIPVQEGNCMEDTVIQHICRMCGLKVKSDTRYTPYDVHSWVTTMEDGMEITYCEWCGVAR